MSKRGNGEGTIYYSEKLNKWVGQFTAGRKPDGKLNRKSVYGNTRKEVKEKMTKALADVQENTFIDKSDVTLIDLINKNIEDAYNANKIKDATYNRKKMTANIIKKLSINDMEIQKITIQKINESLTELVDYSNSVIDKVCSMISNAFNTALLLNIINKNPFAIKGAIIKPNSKKENKKVDSLTIEEQKLFVEELKKDYKYKDIFLIALYTGMRIGEILILTKNDIDLQNNTINIDKTLTIDKNGKVIAGETTKTYAGRREIPFLDILHPTLYNLCNSNENYLFLENNKFLSHSTINSHFKRICKNAEIKVINTKKKKGDKYVNLKLSSVNTHMLRHTFATRCIESGMNAVVLQRLLGHKDIQTTLNTYTSVFNKFKEDELLRLEKYIKNI